MFLLDAPLTMREYMTHEPTPLADISRAIGDFLQGRHDVVVFGAHAVNAYVRVERMTLDVDLVAMEAKKIATELRDYLARCFHIAVRVRAMTKRGAGFRVYQLTKPRNRSLVDVRQETRLPASVSKGGVRFVEPVTLLAMKVQSYAARRNQIKGDTDRVDIRRMLETWPRLRKRHGEVTDKLRTDGAPSHVLRTWYAFVDERLAPDTDDY